MTSGFRHVLHVSAPRFVLSVLLGACSYLVWMGLFLVSTPYHSRFSRGLLWVVAPVITALGFFAGAALFNRFRRLPRLPLSRLYFYPLLGCSIGAAVVFPFGPMLIVFGMCLLGSLSMLLFEFVAFRRLAGTTQNSAYETQARKNGVKP